MEDLKLKIEANSPQELQELQQFIFDNYPDITPTPIYEHGAGFNKEPIIISLIIALGGKKILVSIKEIIESFQKHKLASQKEDNRHKEEMLRLSIKAEKGEYKLISQDDLLDLKVK